jgi:hypothetical protein
VEIWDKGWHYTGADEYDEKGLNHGWFVENASKADENHPAHSIYATSWKKDQGFFPLVWSPKNPSVGGVNVTARYKLKTEPKDTTVGVRFFEGEERVQIKGSITTASGLRIGNFETKAGTADLNDTARMIVAPGGSYRFCFEIDGKNSKQRYSLQMRQKKISTIFAPKISSLLLTLQMNRLIFPKSWHLERYVMFTIT